MRCAVLFALLPALALAAPTIKRADGGSAYTGVGGTAIGGSENAMTNSAGGLLDGGNVLGVGSGNAGDGGKATSGTAVGGDGATSISWVDGHPAYYGGNGGSAYSGAGGNTNGGGVYSSDLHGGYGYYGSGLGLGTAGGAVDGLKLANIDGGNAGDGGDSSSGNAYAGNAGRSI